MAGHIGLRQQRRRKLRGTRPIEKTLVVHGLELADADGALAAGSVVLITGGLGHVGLILAKHLTVTRKCRVVLTSRTPLPPRGEWEEHAKGSARTSKHVNALLDLERQGGEVVAVVADATDLEQMRAAVDVGDPVLSRRVVGGEGRDLLDDAERARAAAERGPAIDGADEVDDRVGPVLRQRGVERVVFAGHSMGGYVVHNVYARHPDRVLGLLMVGTTDEEFSAQVKQDFIDLADGLMFGWGGPLVVLGWRAAGRVAPDGEVLDAGEPRRRQRGHASE